MKHKKGWILLIVLLSYCVTAIDASIVTTGITLIKADLHLNQVSLSWVQNAYLLAFGGMVLLGGRLGDLVGRKRVFILSLILFGTGSFFAGISQEATMMISARFIQGIGAAILAPTSLALLMDTFEGAELVKAIAWYSSVSGLGTSIGMILGGFLASSLSWRYGFFLNIPLTIFMIVVAFQVLDTSKIQKAHFDFLGSVFSILAIFSLVYAINGSKNPMIWLLSAIILLIIFVIVENKDKNPMLPLGIFKSWTRSSAYLVRALFVGSMMGYFFFSAEYMQEVLHFSPLITGFAYLPLTISTFLAALQVPRMVDRYGNKFSLLLGMFLLIAGFGLTIFLTSKQSFGLTIAIPTILLGFGQGFAMSPLTNLGIKDVALKNSGAASGMVNTAHQVGGSIGLSIMVAFTSSYSQMAIEFKWAMIIGLAINLPGFILAVTIKQDN